MTKDKLKARHDRQKIVDRADLRRWRTELPNLYDDLGLDVYAFRLLTHYKRVGTCFENVQTTARHCRMSTGKVSESRAALAKKRLVTLSRNKWGGYTVLVRDIWAKNFAHFSKRRGASHSETLHGVKKGFTTRKRASPSEMRASPGEAKKQQVLRNNIIKKKQQQERVVAVGSGVQSKTREILSQAGITGTALSSLSECVQFEIAREWADWLLNPSRSFRDPVAYMVVTLSKECNAHPPRTRQKATGFAAQARAAGVLNT